MSFKAKGIVVNLIVGAMLVAAGILIKGNSGHFMQMILVMVGLGALVDGLSTLANARRFHFKNATRTLSLIKAAESVLIGATAIVCVLAGASSDFIAAIIYIFAAGLVFSAFVSFQNASVAGSFNASSMAGHFAVRGVMNLLIAVILFARPAKSIDFMVRLFAIAAMAVGALMLLFAVLRMVRGSRGRGKAVDAEAETVEGK